MRAESASSRAQLVPATRAIPRHAFITVTDAGFFPGTLATVNSILEFHPEARVIVVDTGDPGLSSSQSSLLRRAAQVRLVPAARLAREGRKLGPYELKAYACCDLCRDYEVLVLIDSDCLLCSPVAEEIRRCWRLQAFMGGRDGPGVEYDAAYRVYGIHTPCRNPRYLSTSLHFLPINSVSRRILKEWATCCSAAQFNGTGPCPGHGDQGILNAVLFARRRQVRLLALENALWSQHWMFWDHVIEFRKGIFVNRSAGRSQQRSFHCGGVEKFWSSEHAARVVETHPQQSTPYLWFLAMFWFGRCQDWKRDPADYLPPASRHLGAELVQFLPRIRQILPRSRSAWEGMTGVLADRILEGTSPMERAGRIALSGIAQLLRERPNARRVVTVGAGLDLSLHLALRFLNRDTDFYAVESSLDRKEPRRDRTSPTAPRRLLQILGRFPTLRIRLLDAEPDAAADLFDDGSVDLVFLGRGCAGRRLAAAVGAWLPKVARGGIIARGARAAGDERERCGSLGGLKRGVSGIRWWVAGPPGFDRPR